MNYKFYTNILDTTNELFYLIKTEIGVIQNFGNSNWTSGKALKIIEGIEQSKEREKKDEYIWANEDITLYANKNGVLLVDMLAKRGGETALEIITLQLTHDQFIKFLKDFKTFIEENS
ncbi:hypothetical protein [Lacinutrix salivirga]